MKDRIYFLFKQCFLILQYTFLNLRKSWIRYRIRQGKQSWFISRNNNFYNPILKSTVYRYNGGYSIARYGDYFGAFDIKEDAMDHAFQIWLAEKNFTDIAAELEQGLQNIEHKILNKHKYLQRSIPINKESNTLNIITNDISTQKTEHSRISLWCFCILLAIVCIIKLAHSISGFLYSIL